MKRRPFPIGAKAEPYDDPAHDAAHRELMRSKSLPRLREIAAFLDEGDRLGLRWSLETLVSISDEMLELLVVTWGGLSDRGRERMIEQNLPALGAILDLRKANAERAKQIIAQRKEA
jgi:hypothetical protein